MSIENKAAALTGASSGVGRSISPKSGKGRIRRFAPIANAWAFMIHQPADLEIGV